MNRPVVMSVIAHVTCPGAFHSLRRTIQYNPKPKASKDKLKISSNLPNVKMAMIFPPRMTPVSHSSDIVGSLRRNREPIMSVEIKLMANQIAERYSARVSIELMKDKSE